MTLLLDHLACQRCGTCFWPRQAPWAPWILCPSCGGPHANTQRVERTPRRYAGRIEGPAAPALLAWMQRWWPDTLPPAELLGSANSGKVESGIHDGFPFVVEKMVVFQYMPAQARVLVAAFAGITDDAPPSEAQLEAQLSQSLDRTKSLLWGSHNRMRVPAPPPVACTHRIGPGPIYVGFGPAGAWAYANTELGSSELLTHREAWAGRLVEWLVERGAEPPLPMVNAPANGEAAVVAPPSDLAGGRGATGAAEARSIRCAGCGASFRADAVLCGGLCPYCGMQLALEPGVAAEIDAYRRSVQAYQFRSRTRLDPDKLWAQTNDPGALHMSCASCGAPNAHEPGRLDETCAYCGSALVPATGLMDLGVHRVADAAHAEHVAAGRRLDRTAASWDRFGRQHMLLTGGVIVVSGASYVCFLPVPLLMVHNAWGPVASALCVLVSLVLAGVVAGLLFRQWKKTKKKNQAWDDAYRALAEQLGGRGGELAVLERWLPRFWRDAFPIGAFRSGPREGAVEFTLATLPMVLEADPIPAGTSPMSFVPAARARAVILAAGQLPFDALGRLRAAPASETHAALDRCGFIVELHVGGLLVKAKPETISTLAEAPGRLAALGPVAFAAARLAHQLGIQSVASG